MRSRHCVSQYIWLCREYGSQAIMDIQDSGATLELRQTSEMDGFGFESFCLLLVMATEMEPPEPCLPEQPLSHWTKTEVKK